MLKKETIKLWLLFTVIILILSISNRVFATTLTISVSTDKDSYNIDQEVKVKVKWSQEMQAAGFTLNYDANKIKFVSASIGDSFYNSETDGKIVVNWASFDDKDSTSIDFVFKTKEAGNCNISISNPKSFANKNLESPTDYDISTSATKKIEIKNADTIDTEKKDYNSGTEENNNQSNNNQSNNNQSDTNKETGKTTNSEKKDNTQATNGRIPQTGVEHIMPIILVIIISSIIFYKKYNNLSEI